MALPDKLKYVAAALLAVGGLAVYLFVPLGSKSWQFLPVVVGVVLAVAVFLLSSAGRRFVAYAGDSVGEAKKVAWPTRKEAMQMTMIVFAFVALLAIFLWLVDSAIAWLFYDVILNRGS